jgi:alpha-tubulin suppressor-like RCC1 family protein
MACGGEHTVMVCDDNTVWATGHGEKGQLGCLNGATLLELPTLVDSIFAIQREVLSVTCGNSSVLYLLGKHQPVSSLGKACMDVIMKFPQLSEKLEYFVCD